MDKLTNRIMMMKKNMYAKIIEVEKANKHKKLKIDDMLFLNKLK